MLVERVDHFLLLLVVVAVVEMLGLVLLIQFRASLEAVVLLLRADLRLHVG